MNILFIHESWNESVCLTNHLRAKGHSVQTTGDAYLGMLLAVSSDFDAILLDRVLVGMSGITLCGKLRLIGCQLVPILVLTNVFSLDVKIESFEAGADDFLVKSLGVDRLEQRIRAAFRFGNKQREC